MGKLFAVIGAGFGFLSVALGAFAAHALKERVPARMLEVFQTGVNYQVYHALALMVLGVAMILLGESNWGKWAGWIMIAGILLFSGSLYVLALTGVSKIGAITPVGGVLFLTGWILLALYFWNIR